ncbi:MAG: S-layer homology domain-containing protein [Anaerovoracaceae bacterium]
MTVMSIWDIRPPSSVSKTHLQLLHLPLLHLRTQLQYLMALTICLNPTGHIPNVNKMVEKNIIVGYPDGTFKPNNQVTYGEFIKMAVVGLTERSPGGGKCPESLGNELL